jgi:hypothetical protein
MVTSLRSKWVVGKARGERISGPFDALSLAQGIRRASLRSPFQVYSPVCVEWLEVKAGEFRFESVKDSDFQP